MGISFAVSWPPTTFYHNVSVLDWLSCTVQERSCSISGHKAPLKMVWWVQGWLSTCLPPLHHPWRKVKGGSSCAGPKSVMRGLPGGLVSWASDFRFCLGEDLTVHGFKPCAQALCLALRWGRREILLGIVSLSLSLPLSVKNKQTLKTKKENAPLLRSCWLFTT